MPIHFQSLARALQRIDEGQGIEHLERHETLGLPPDALDQL